MKIVAPLVLLLWTLGARGSVEPANDLQQRLLDELARLSNQVTSLQQELQQVKQAQEASTVENAAIRRQVASLSTAAAPMAESLDYAIADQTVLEEQLVDLSEGQTVQLAHSTGSNGSHVLSNPWWQNFYIGGFGATGYYDTGSGGSRDNGNFEIKEATLFVEADVWENIGFFIELQVNRLDKDDEKFARTGEVYIHLRDVLESEGSAVGLKFGRFDLPFGEEYLWQDAIDNPLITNSASYVYGWDEGILAYGHWRDLGWIAAISDGTDTRSDDENSDKAFNLKLYGNPASWLYVSGSYMYNGDNQKSAIEFGGSHFQPVRGSAAGDSSSLEVDSNLFELDSIIEFEVATMPGYLALTAGWARQNDPDSAFDRDFRWFTVEPFLHISHRLYTVLRYSEIGTYDDDEGYQFDGKIFAGGSGAFGYDVQRLRRLGIGLGWQPNPRTRAKLEIGRDWFDLIEASTLDNDNNRNFIGVELAVGF